MIQYDEEKKEVTGTTTEMKGLEPHKLDHKINRYFFLAIIILFGLLLYYSLAQFLGAFLGAVIIYILARKRMDKLIKKGWRKSSAAVVIILLSIVILIIPIATVGVMLYNKGKSYIANPDRIVNTLQQVRTKVETKYGLHIISDQKIAEIKNSVTGAISGLLNESLDVVGNLAMLFFFLYFMLISINRMEAAIIFFLPFKRSKIELFGKELVAQTFSNSIGVPAIAIAQGLVGFAAYAICGIPDAAFWAVMTGFASVLPIVGTAIVFLPLCVYLVVTDHDWYALFLLIYGFGVLGSTDNVIRFVLAKRMADVHPIITVLGVIMGVQYFGLAGLIFGPVLISFFIILLKIYYLEYQSTVPPVRARRNVPIRFKLPFLGARGSKKKPPNYANDRGQQ